MSSVITDNNSVYVQKYMSIIIICRENEDYSFYKSPYALSFYLWWRVLSRMEIYYGSAAFIVNMFDKNICVCYYD